MVRWESGLHSSLKIPPALASTKKQWMFWFLFRSFTVVFEINVWYHSYPSRTYNCVTIQLLDTELVSSLRQMKVIRGNESRLFSTNARETVESRPARLLCRSSVLLLAQPKEICRWMVWFPKILVFVLQLRTKSTNLQSIEQLESTHLPCLRSSGDCSEPKEL